MPGEANTLMAQGRNHKQLYSHGTREKQRITLHVTPCWESNQGQSGQRRVLHAQGENVALFQMCGFSFFFPP